MLPRTGFRDDTGLTNAAGKENLTDSIVYLMGSCVIPATFLSMIIR